MKLGIDFGTTRTIVAACDRGNYPVASFETSSGDLVDAYPSIVAARGDELEFGLAAADRAADPEWEVLRSFKRLLSEPQAGPDRVVRLADREIALADLISQFLAALRKDLLERSNTPFPKRFAGELEAVVATPANARSPQRFVTLDAFRNAGFDVVAVLNEPSAAGVEYAHRHKKTLTSQRQRVLVYDLGGGTFDASLVEMREDVHDVIRSGGIGRLGGDDFDRVLADLVLEAAGIARASLGARELAELLDACRDQKERLNPNSRRVVVETSSAGAVELPVDVYYEACGPMIERTIDLTMAVLGASEDDEEAVAALAGLYVVGGASALPAVARALRDRFGRRVHRSVYPAGAIAIGLAIAFDEAAGVRVKERLARRFGVFREQEGGREITFDPIFDFGTEVPAPGESPKRVVRTYRAAHNLGHFRFVECDYLDAGGAPSGELSPSADVYFPFDPALRQDGVDLGSVAIARVGIETGPLIEERYEIRPGGIIELDITALETGFSRHYRLGGAIG